MCMKEILEGRKWLESSEKEIRDRERASDILRASTPFLRLLGATTVRALQMEPVYIEPRVGQGGKEFLNIKSRTTFDGMSYEDQKNLPFELRMVRLFALDEVLQTAHVLRGEMYLTGGPRPLAETGNGDSHQSIEMMEKVLSPGLFDEWYDAYTFAKPAVLSTYGNRSKLLSNAASSLEEQCDLRARLDLEDIENASPERDDMIIAEAMGYLRGLEGVVRGV